VTDEGALLVVSVIRLSDEKPDHNPYLVSCVESITFHPS
jgi:hypothetical protein